MSFLVRQPPKTVSFHTLGCKLNYAETSTISRLFVENGYLKVDFGQKSDVVVINSCTVTAQADKKCRQAISKAVKISPGAIVVIIGCYAELKAEEISNLPGVSLVLGNQEKFNIIDRINSLLSVATASVSGCNAKERFFPSYSLFDRTRSFLKVQDGCDYRCSYCTIPKARGNSRNAPINEIAEQARTVASKGVKEIVLTGVNIGDFGQSTGESFIGLLSALNEIKQLERIRIGSVEPNLISTEIIQMIGQSDILAPHFHIPLQSGCNKILGLMGRRYRRELFADKVLQIHKLIPHAAIGADVIVGFPGETDEDFEETQSFIQNLDLSYLHVFIYSERPDTRAINFPGKVPHHIAEQRSKTLIRLSEEKRRNFYNQHIGKTLKTLFEQKEKNNTISGFTDNYIKVEIPFDDHLIGKCIPVLLSDISESGNVISLHP